MRWLHHRMPIAAVVIGVPACNEAERIEQCLESLVAALDELPTAVATAVTVACDSCGDGTADLIRAFARHRPGIVATEGTWGTAGLTRRVSIAAGLRRLSITRPVTSAATWIATTDADTQVPADWLTRQIRYADEGADAIAGLVELHQDEDRTDAVLDHFTRSYQLDARDHPHVHGANLGARANAYLVAGGFPPLDVAEDHALWNALRRGGFRTVSPHDVIVSTSARLRGRAPGGFAASMAAALAS